MELSLWGHVDLLDLQQNQPNWRKLNSRDLKYNVNVNWMKLKGIRSRSDGYTLEKARVLGVYENFVHVD